MPISKNARKSRSGQSRKANRLKNGQHRYRPGTGPIPGAPTTMNWLGAAAALAIMERPQEYEAARIPSP